MITKSNVTLDTDGGINKRSYLLKRLYMSVLRFIVFSKYEAEGYLIESPCINRLQFFSTLGKVNHNQAHLADHDTSLCVGTWEGLSDVSCTQRV